ncbi:MAG: DUF1285 domain-containing protein [Minwuia sp.]|nr:DUF1285 domain-containing protein [Minwuia sp.]
MAERGTDKPHLDIADLAERMSAAAGRGYPPVDRWHPEHEGVIDMRITADGTWLYQGSPIQRAGMVRLFSTVLRRDDDGHHYLVTPAEKQRITVDVAPLHIVEMFREGEGDTQKLVFRTLTDDMVVLDAAHRLRVEVDPETGEPTPLVPVRGNLMAIILRSVFYDLVDIAEERDVAGVAVQGVMSEGIFHIIGRVDGAPHLDESEGKHGA